jgi:glyoxylate reductase|uniref:D-glycerate dehydrogenase n=1 Tax=candidate division WOR-3 bacterium TaxID=2052148 RepID=A0A7C4TD40_UNCW3
MKRYKIFITRKIPEPAIKLLRNYFSVSVFGENRPIRKIELIKSIKDKVGIITLLTDFVDREILENAMTLRMIANYAAGYNNIDIEEATKRGIMVTNTPDVLTETTADLTFGMILAIARRIPEAEKFLRKNRFKGWAPLLFLGADVHHKTLGIIGMGRIGKAVARRALGFKMNVIYYDKVRLSPAEEKKLSASYKPFNYILKKADFITIHTPLTKETYHLFSEKEFSLMKKTAFIINTARGPVIDEKALIKALNNKKIGGCALDVFENEPVVSEELKKMDNVLLLPHIGSATLETRTNMALMCAENLITALIKNKRPPNLVNPEVLNIKYANTHLPK